MDEWSNNAHPASKRALAWTPQDDPSLLPPSPAANQAAASRYHRRHSYTGQADFLAQPPSHNPPRLGPWVMTWVLTLWMPLAAT